MRSSEIRGPELMRQEEPRRGDPIRPWDWLEVIPFAASGRLGWVGLEAARYRAAPAVGVQPAPHHSPLARSVHSAAGGAGTGLRGGEAARATPGRIDRAGAGRHPGHVALERPQRHTPRLPGAGPGRAGGRRHVRPRPGAAADPAARRAGPAPAPGSMGAVDAELTAGPASGGRLAAESLANLLAVHLIRHVLAHPAGLSAGGTARCRGGGSAPSSSISRNTSRPARPWSRWPRSPASAPTTSPGSSRRPPGCRRTSTSSHAASNEPKGYCKQGRTCLWRRSLRTPASPTRASSPIISSATSASRRRNSGCPQESPNRPQVPPRSSRATPLPFPMSEYRWLLQELVEQLHLRILGTPPQG